MFQNNVLCLILKENEANRKSDRLIFNIILNIRLTPIPILIINLIIQKNSHMHMTMSILNEKNCYINHMFSDASI